MTSDKITETAGQLAAHLAAWQARDDRAGAAARRSANDAMDAIDAMLAELHTLRARLVSEIRASDDATAARVDAMLAEGQAVEAGPAAARASAPRPHLAAVEGGAEVDAVHRRAAYERDHPDTSITPPGPGQTLWIARRGGAVLCAEYWLGALMDSLDGLDAG